MNYENYRLIKKLGKGAFGIIYLAQNRETKQKVALKTYREDIEWETIENAAESAMKLNHPNLMKTLTFFHDRIVFESNRLSGKSTVHFFTVLEYLPGLTLGELVKQEGLDVYQTLDNFLPQIISGLKYLHSHNIIHRDIKPENIIINDKVAKIIDFDFLTNSKIEPKPKMKFGTPFYMSPEMYLSYNYDQRSDNWSLGVTIYFCLRNNYPFLGENRSELKESVLNDQPDYQDIDTKYKQILEGLFIKDPENRLNLTQVLTLI